MRKIISFENFINENTDFDNRYKPESLQELIESLGALEFDNAYRWIRYFGGRELLNNKQIPNGYFLLNMLLSGDITIDEIDEVTKGAHGQSGDISFSETNLTKSIIIPALEYIEMIMNANKYNL